MIDVLHREPVASLDEQALASRYHRAYGLSRAGAFRPALDELSFLADTGQMGNGQSGIHLRAMRLRSKLECWLEVGEPGKSRADFVELAKTLRQADVAEGNRPMLRHPRLAVDLAADLSEMCAFDLAKDLLSLSQDTEVPAANLLVANASHQYRLARLSILAGDLGSAARELSDSLDAASEAVTLQASRGARRQADRAERLESRARLLLSAIEGSGVAETAKAALESCQRVQSRAGWAEGFRPHQAAGWMSLAGNAHAALGAVQSKDSDSRRHFGIACICLGFSFSFSINRYPDLVDASVYRTSLQVSGAFSKSSRVWSSAVSKINFQAPGVLSALSAPSHLYAEYADGLVTRERP